MARTQLENQKNNTYTYSYGEEEKWLGTDH
jgi:hypothetical protein